MRIRLQGSGHAARLLSELNRCRLSRLLCDVVLQVGGRSFPAHRAVLACTCTHFNSLFSRGSRNGSIPTTLSLDFVSATNFEKVLTFIYTGEIFTDLIDVGVLYELAERLGVKELVSACHATFPDLQSSSSGDPVADGDMESEMVSVATVATSVCSSSAASCSSLSSSAAPTPVTPSPVPQGRNSRRNRSHSATVSLSQSPKNEDLHLEYSQLVTNKPSPPDSNRSAEALPGLTLQLKMEQDDEGDAGGNISVDHLVVNGSKSTFGSPPETRSVPDSSAQLGGETCAPSSSSNDPLDSLQLGSVAGGVGVKDLGFFEDDDARKRQHMQEEQTEAGDQWRALSEDIIELSDEEEHYIVEEEDDEDLMCIENGEHGTLGQLASSQPCKACGMLLPAENGIIRTHAETHLSETGSCQVCGASFSEHGAGVTHALTHVGILLFSCDICEQQFQSEAALIHHRRQSATKCSPQNPEHLNPDAPSRRQGGELQCAVCAKVTANDFKAVREHVQSHTCLRTLRCGVCQLAQSSRCALLWHTLTHLFPIYTCPQCGSPFLESSLLDRHLALHAEEEPSAKQDGNSPETSGESQVELRCFLCPQIFRSESAFHYHLSVHSNELQGSQVWPSKRKADQLLEYSSSSSSPLEAGGSSGKSGSAGFNVSLGFNLQDRGPPFPANGNSGAVSSGAGLRQKWYRCRYCGKHFAHSGEFTYHLRIHTGEKPYQCKVCLRFFRGRSTMICHLKTHSGALMYRCTVCGLFFSTLKMVSSHMELHKDQLPPDFNIEETFMYNDHSKEPVPNMDT